MLRFLVAAPVRSGHAKNGLCLGLALRRLGHEVRFFDYSQGPARLRIVPKPLRGKAWQRLMNEAINESLLEAVERFKPDVFFCVKGVQLAPETIREIGRRGVRTVGYWIDDPLDHERSLMNAGTYHLYLTNDQGSLGSYARHGISNVHYYPSAVDCSLFRPLDRHLHAATVSFVGTLSARRLEVMAQLTDYELQIRGPGWLKNSGLPRCKVGHEVFGEAVNRVFNDSKVNLNIHNWFGQGSAMNLRLFEVPAAGGFLLTDWVEEIDAHFHEDRHVVCWHSVDELRAKLNWYLAHEAARERIARAGHEHVVKHHTYDRRASDLLALLRTA